MLLRRIAQGAVNDLRTPIPMLVRTVRAEVITREKPFHLLTTPDPEA
jgi:hypothetical protein